MTEAASVIANQLKIKKSPEGRSSHKNWRRSDEYYTTGKALKSGQVMLGPAWFELGWKVRLFSISRTSTTYLLTQSKGPIVLADTKTAAAKQWMEELNEVGALMDGVIAVLHPELYRVVRERHATLHPDDAALRAFLDAWPSSYHGAQMIVNRETIMHRDQNGLPGWLDALLSVGTYGDKAVLALGTFGASVPYDSGSLVMVSSRVVLHGVPAVPPDRICLAWLWKDGIIPTPESRDLPEWAKLPRVYM